MNTLSRSRQPDRAQQLALGALAAVEQAAARPPRRTSSAGSPRRALGTEPPVPAKNRDRSMPATVASDAVRGISQRARTPGGHAGKLCRATARGLDPCPPAPVAQWIERSPPEREVASSNLAGRVALQLGETPQAATQAVGSFGSYVRAPTLRRKFDESPSIVRSGLAATSRCRHHVLPHAPVARSPSDIHHRSLRINLRLRIFRHKCLADT